MWNGGGYGVILFPVSGVYSTDLAAPEIKTHVNVMECKLVLPLVQIWSRSVRWGFPRSQGKQLQIARSSLRSIRAVTVIDVEDDLIDLSKRWVFTLVRDRMGTRLAKSSR